MSKRLLGDTNWGVISPLIDVVVNAFAVMFVLFVVYLILFPSGREEPEPIRFLRLSDISPVIEGQSYVYTFPVTGGGGRRRFALDGQLPSYLEFDTTSGTIAGHVAASGRRSSHEYQITVTVHDESGESTIDSDTLAAVLAVFPVAIPYDSTETPLKIGRQKSRLPAARVGYPYREYIGAQGGVEPYEWQLVVGRLPAGLGITDGYIVGTPRQPGTYEFTIEVSHSSGSYEYRGKAHRWTAERRTADFSLTVVEELRHYLVLSTGRVGEPFFGGVYTNNTTEEEQIRIASAIPGVLAVEGSPFISGTPADTGGFEVSYTIRRGTQVIASGSDSARILPEALPPTVGPSVLQAWKDETMRCLIPYRGLPEPIRECRCDKPLPEGIRIEGSYLVGTPTRTGLYRVDIIVVDAEGDEHRGEVTIRVGERF